KEIDSSRTVEQSVARRTPKAPRPKVQPVRIKGTKVGQTFSSVNAASARTIARQSRLPHSSAVTPYNENRMRFSQKPSVILAGGPPARGGGGGGGGGKNLPKGDFYHPFWG